MPSVSKVMDSPELIGGICILKALDYNKKNIVNGMKYLKIWLRPAMPE